MVGVVSLLLVVAFSMLIVRVGTVALTMTGLSEEVSRFQALSAYAGAGFTTGESESVVADPARRRVVALLIRLGSVGLVTAISSLMLSFIGAGQAAPMRLLVLLLGGAVLIVLARSETFSRMLTPVIERALAHTTDLKLRDYANLLHLQDDYRIVEIDVEADSWLSSQQLDKLDLPAEGVLVLGIIRPDEGYVGAPPPDIQLRAEDRLVVYGRAHRLDELSTRAAGDRATHEAAKAEHSKDRAEDKQQVGHGSGQEDREAVPEEA